MPSSAGRDHRYPPRPPRPLRLLFRVTARAPASSRQYRWHELRVHRAAAACPSRRRDLRAMRPRPSSRWNASYLHRRNAARPLRRRLPKPSTTVHGRVEILLTGTPRPARGRACTSARHPGNGSLPIAAVEATLMTRRGRSGREPLRRSSPRGRATSRAGRPRTRRDENPVLRPGVRVGINVQDLAPRAVGDSAYPRPLTARHLKSLAGTPGSSLSGTATSPPRRPPDARGAQPHGPPPPSNGDRAPPRHRTRTDRNRFRYCARTTISLQDGVSAHDHATYSPRRTRQASVLPVCPRSTCPPPAPVGARAAPASVKRQQRGRRYRVPCIQAPRSSRRAPAAHSSFRSFDRKSRHAPARDSRAHPRLGSEPIDRPARLRCSVQAKG
jgi:hypothetical protein